jgi:pullulanase
VLWDKLAISAKNATEEERKNMDKLAISIVLTSQGISFLHAGTEFLRSKKGVENSFESPDSINEIDWSLKTKNKDVFEYLKTLIKIRKQHPAFRMMSSKQVADNIRFMENLPDRVVAYTINGMAVKDSWNKIAIIFNGNGKEMKISLPEGRWQKVSLPGQSLFLHKSFPSIVVPAYSCTILYQ